MEHTSSQPIRRFRWAQLAVDAGIVFVAYLGTLVFRFDGKVPDRSWSNFRWAIPVLVLVYLVCNYIFGLYEHGFPSNRADIYRTLLVGLSATVLSLFVVLTVLSEGLRPLPLSVVLLGGPVATAGFALSRHVGRLRRAA